MPRKTNNQKVANSVRGSVEKFSGDLEALSSQIASLTDAIISEKNLAASKIKSERELLARKTALQNIKEDIDDLRSERRKNQDKLDRLISEQQKEAEKEKEENRKKETQYSDSAKKSFESGQFISGMIFKFLGRNEKDKKQIEAERKADRQDQIQELRNRSKELNEQTKSLKDIRNNINVLNTNIVNAEEERIYEQRDAEKPVSDISKFASVKLLDIEPEALSKLEKIISKSKAADGGGLTLTDAIGSSVILKKTLETFSKIRPLLQAITQGGLGTTLLAITGGLAGAAASWSLFFKGLNDEQEAYNKRRETEEEDRKRVAGAKTKREDTQARSDVDKVLETAKEQQYDTTKADVVDQLANTYEEEGKKLNDQRRMNIALALRERAKNIRASTPPTPAEVPPTAEVTPTVEMQPQVVGIEGKSEALAYDYAPTPTKLNLAEVTPIKIPTVTPKKVVPKITPPKAGARPAAQVESSFIDNILGKIGSFLPTGVGSLSPTAMAATTPYVPPTSIIPTKPTKPTKLPLNERDQYLDLVNKGIFGFEAGGNYDIAFGDRFSKTGKIINTIKNAKQLTAEEFSGKKLSEMTLGEVQAFQQAREKVSGGQAAVGRSQFMPATLFGQTRKGIFYKGLTQQLGLSMDTVFNQELQDRLARELLLSNLKTLTRSGIEATPGNLYMSNYIGAKGTIDLQKAIKEGTAGEKSVADIISGGDPKEYAKKIANNPELAKIKAKDFESILASRVTEKSPELKNLLNNSAVQNLYSAAANNKAMQQQTQGNNVVAVNNNVVNTQTPKSSPRKELRSTINPIDDKIHSNTRSRG